MNNTNQVLGGVSFMSPLIFSLSGIYEGKLKPLTEKEQKRLEQLEARKCFNDVSYKIIRYGNIQRPVFVHAYKKGKIVPKEKIAEVWRDGNVDPKYVLTSKGFVLISEMYDIDTGTCVPYSQVTSITTDNNLWDKATYNGETTGPVTFDVDHIK